MVNLTLVVTVLNSIFITLCKADCGQILEKGVSDADKSTIVKTHNYLRSLISEGKLSNQPRGKNLKTIRWDDRLAKEAQRIANRCEMAHVKVRDRRFFSVGQNLGRTASSEPNEIGADWKGIIQKWFDEHKAFIYPNTSTGVTGHYTQVVWADTFLVGCGYTTYQKNSMIEKIYVCNYGPGVNFIGRAPYKV